MTYSECEWLSSLTRERRERACRRAWMKQMAIQWGGWVLAGLMMAINLAVAVH